MLQHWICICKEGFNHEGTKGGTKKRTTLGTKATKAFLESLGAFVGRFLCSSLRIGLLQWPAPAFLIQRSRVTFHLPSERAGAFS